MSSNPFSSFAQSVINYFPNLVAGVILIVLGLVAGWIIKRIVFQFCVILRIERLLISFRWGEEFSKADIRHALFNTIGNAAFALVFLVFLNAALSALQLTVLSNLIERGVIIIPRVFVSLLILGIGWLIARWVGMTVRRGLLKEGVPRATLIGRFSNAIFLLFFSAMALVELDIAREIVIIGFTTIIVTLSILTIVFTFRGGRDLAQKIFHVLDEDDLTKS